MEFDKSMVYTALNADELKVGSKVIVANTIIDLKKCVAKYYEENVITFVTMITGIECEESSLRFRIDTAIGDYASDCWALAYFVEEPSTFLKWTDLKIGDIITNNDTFTSMVVAVDSCNDTGIHIYSASHGWISDAKLTTFHKVEE